MPDFADTGIVSTAANMSSCPPCPPCGTKRRKSWAPLRGMGSIYDPSGYPEGVPNPYGARVHAWGEGPWPEEGTRFHGPLYTRAMWSGRWQEHPFNGIGQEEEDSVLEEDLERSTLMKIGIPISFGLALAVIGAEITHHVVDNANGSATARFAGALAGGFFGGLIGALGGTALVQE